MATCTFFLVLLVAYCLDLFLFFFFLFFFFFFFNFVHFPNNTTTNSTCLFRKVAAMMTTRRMTVMLLVVGIVAGSGEDGGLRFNAGTGQFKIVQFTDQHYGEGEDAAWGREQDINSTRVMHQVLAHEAPDLVVYTGDQLTGNNIHDNATTYWQELLAPTRQANLKCAGIHIATTTTTTTSSSSSSAPSMLSTSFAFSPHHHHPC